MNNGLPPTVSTMGSTLMLQFPVSMQFQAFTVISSGDATFDLNGTVFATTKRSFAG